MDDDRPCPSGKRDWLTKPKADKAADRGAKWDDRRGKRRAVLTSYRCPDCHGWHLTSQRRRDHPNNDRRRSKRGR